MFGSPKTLFSSTTTTSTGLFGANDNKPLFGATSTTPALGGKLFFLIFRFVDKSFSLK